MTWRHSETHYHPNDEATAATRFFLGNGLLGLRGSLDELGTKGVQGLFAAGVFRQRFVRQFETADTYTRKRRIFDEEIMPRGKTLYEIQGLPDILFCRIDLGGEVFRMWEGELMAFSRALDLGRGTLRRDVDWRSPGGRRARLTFERFCSWEDPRHVWQRVEIVPEADERVGLAPGIDPTLEDGIEAKRWRRDSDAFAFDAVAEGSGIVTRFRQRWRLTLDGEGIRETGAADELAGRPMRRFEVGVAAGRRLAMERVTAIAPDNHPEYAAENEALDEATARAMETGYDRALDLSAARLAAKWDEADVELDGPERDRLGLRYAIYQLLAAAPWSHDHISLGAKCLSGQGYNGHVFWDNEANVLPFYDWVFPEVSANHCRYRYRMLDDARKRAEDAGRPGARYPWQSSLEGFEHAPDFIRAGRTQIHIVADVPYAANRLARVAGESAAPPRPVAEMTMECARYLRSILEWNPDAERHEIRGVGGPDEYHTETDNNAYTNYLTAHILETAARWAERFPELAGAGEAPDWRAAARSVYLPMDARNGLIPQCDGFLDLAETWEAVESDWGGIGAEFEQCKALKQPDTLLLLTLLPGRFDTATWRVNWDYYERFILHGSSLSPSIHALVGARAGLPQRARHYFDIAAQFEFRDTNKDTRHGIHIGNCGGLWQATVFGFAGLGEAGDGLALDPCLPAEWNAIRFRLRRQGQAFRVEVGHARAEVAADPANTEPAAWSAFGETASLAPGDIKRFARS